MAKCIKVEDEAYINIKGLIADMEKEKTQRNFFIKVIIDSFIEDLKQCLVDIENGKE